MGESDVALVVGWAKLAVVWWCVVWCDDGVVWCGVVWCCVVCCVVLRRVVVCVVLCGVVWCDETYRYQDR